MWVRIWIVFVGPSSVDGFFRRRDGSSLPFPFWMSMHVIVDRDAVM